MCPSSYFSSSSHWAPLFYFPARRTSHKFLKFLHPWLSESHLTKRQQRSTHTLHTYIHTYPEEKVEDKHQVLDALHSPHGSEKLSNHFSFSKQKSPTRKSSRARLSCLNAAVWSEQEKQFFFFLFPVGATPLHGSPGYSEEVSEVGGGEGRGRGRGLVGGIGFRALVGFTKAGREWITAQVRAIRSPPPLPKALKGPACPIIYCKQCCCRLF